MLKLVLNDFGQLIFCARYETDFYVCQHYYTTLTRTVLYIYTLLPSFNVHLQNSAIFVYRQRICARVCALCVYKCVVINISACMFARTSNKKKTNWDKRLIREHESAACFIYVHCTYLYVYCIYIENVIRVCCVTS